jgi:hypothetical protein
MFVAGARRGLAAAPDDEAAAYRKIGEPSRVVHVTLTARYVLHMCGIRQDQCETLFQNEPDRLPVHARRFHRHMRASGALQPVSKFQQSPRRCWETPDVSLYLSLADKPQAGHHLRLVHVETRAPFV